MENQLLVPNKIRVGYQKRNDTYTKKLAYVIYYDEKGKLRKEKSFESWRQKSIPVNEFDNKPHSGFVLNKDVKRSAEWFGDGRNMIRIYDDRGIEFEITTGNLTFILMTTNCHKRGFEGEFVYAWQGTELILLPTGCDEYKNSIAFTDLKTKSVHKKNLKEGYTYLTKRQFKLTYIGRFKWYAHSHWDDDKHHEGQEFYIFYDEGEKKFVTQKNLTALATALTDTPVSNFADLVDQFYKSKNGSPAKSLTSIPKKFKIENGMILNEFIDDNNDDEEDEEELDDDGNVIKTIPFKYCYFDTFSKIDDNKYLLHDFEADMDYRSESDKWKGTYSFRKTDNKSITIIDNRVTIKNDSKKYSGSPSGFKKTIKDLQADKRFVELYVVFESGAKIPYLEYTEYDFNDKKY